MTTLLLIILSTLFLSYANGANDNFKGVATLFGSGTTDYRPAIIWATLTTFMGSICALFLADQLIERFSGKGLVPEQVAASPEFLLAVALGAGLTILIAALKGLPVSTTHGLIGALTGAGIMAVGHEMNLSVLGNSFFLPLLVSPLIAFLLGSVIYIALHSLRRFMGISKEHCICIGTVEAIIPVTHPVGAMSASSVSNPEIRIDTEQRCIERYSGSFLGVNWQKIIDHVHYLSAGTVCFARGLNDTPKIVALLTAVNALAIESGLLLVGAAIAFGGILNARRVAETMSKKITPMSHGQGFAANIATGVLVIFASRLGMPVSTTHVSVGSIFGIGYLTGNADKRVISDILLAWVLTLPIAASLSGGIYACLALTGAM